MEKKSIIAVIVILLLIVIIGVTIFFVNRQGEPINNSESEANNVVNEENTPGPKDTSESIPSDANSYIFTE